MGRQFVSLVALSVIWVIGWADSRLDQSDSFQLTPAVFLSGKTPYYPQQHYSSYEGMPVHCKLVHINHLGRHGSRHITKLKAPLHLYDALAEALRLGKLKPRGVMVLQWIARFAESEGEKLGLLTEEGRREHEETAYRQWAHLGADLKEAMQSGRRFVFEATHKSRAMGSRDAFIRGFANAARTVLRNSSLAVADIITHDDTVERTRLLLLQMTKKLRDHMHADVASEDTLVIVQPPLCPGATATSNDDDEDDWDVGTRRPLSTLNSAVAKSYKPSAVEQHHYAKLRFFDTCSSYLKYKKDKAWVAALAPYSVNASRHDSSENNFLSQIFENDHLMQLAEVGSVKRSKRKGRGGGALPLSHVGKKGKGSGSDKRGFFASKPLPAKSKSKERTQTADLVKDLYAVCQIQANAYHELDEVCKLFERHLNVMGKYELLADLHDYFKQGAGDPTASGMSCLLVEDFISAGDEGAGAAWAPPEDGLGPDPASSLMVARGLKVADAAARRVRRGPSTVFSHYRFGHSETVVPFLSILGLYQEPNAPSLHDYYHSMLSRGTRHLLNETRARAAEISATHVAYTWEAPGAEEEAVELQLAQLLEGVSGGAFSGQLQHHRHTRHASHHGIATGTPSRRLPFTTPTMLALKHPWSGARLIPMAANVQWMLYDCGDGPVASATTAAGALPEASRMSGLWAKMLHNEREVQFPPCAHHVPHGQHKSGHNASAFQRSDSNLYASRQHGLHFPCPWEVVKDYFRKVAYPAHGIQTCDAEDWVRLCGGVGECADDGDD